MLGCDRQACDGDSAVLFWNNVLEASSLHRGLRMVAVQCQGIAWLTMFSVGCTTSRYVCVYIYIYTYSYTH